MHFLFVGRFASIVLWVTVFSNITNLTQKKKKKSADMDNIYNCRFTLTPKPHLPLLIYLYLTWLLKKKQPYIFKVFHEESLAIDVVYFWGNGPICYGLIAIPCAIDFNFVQKPGNLRLFPKKKCSLGPTYVT
jgi:hypothetical protein